MTYDEETYVLHILKKIRDETNENNILLKENNKMLKQLINFITGNIINHNKENNEDFVRNILANMISTQLEVFKNRK